MPILCIPLQKIRELMNETSFIGKLESSKEVEYRKRILSKIIGIHRIQHELLPCEEREIFEPGTSEPNAMGNCEDAV